MPLNDCKKFWGKIDDQISAYEKLKLLAVTGGVPKYLEEIAPHQSAEENIKKLCFIRGGLLVNEFNQIFSDIFLRDSYMYRAILESLVNGPKEIKAICEKLKISQTGLLSQYLHELELAGFIKRDYTWHIATGEDSKLSQFRLSDNYFRFYLKYISKNLSKIERDHFTLKSLSHLSEWNTILGFQFVNLVLNNRLYVQKCLRLIPEDIIADNPFFQHKTIKQNGCQIDYLIQTRANSLYVCEIKFYRTLIGKDIIAEVKQKISRLTKPKGFSIRPVLIHINGVTDELIESNFFAEIINIGALLAPIQY